MVKSTYMLKALNEIQNLMPDEEFILRDLFRGYEWKRISKSSRLSLGTEFYKYINSPANSYPIIATEKSKSNKQKYKVINI